MPKSNSIKQHQASPAEIKEGQKLRREVGTKKERAKQNNN